MMRGGKQTGTAFAVGGVTGARVRAGVRRAGVRRGAGAARLAVGAPRRARRRVRAGAVGGAARMMDERPGGGAEGPDGAEKRDEAERDATRQRVESITGTTMAEIDELAEEWIGADLGRWEWYERVKARRERMMKAGRVNEDKFDEELEELKRTFMEIDALFGTGMLNERSEISASGWGTVTVITLMYICAGFWAIELVVRFITSLKPGFP